MQCSTGHPRSGAMERPTAATVKSMSAMQRFRDCRVIHQCIVNVSLICLHNHEFIYQAGGRLRKWLFSGPGYVTVHQWHC